MGVLTGGQIWLGLLFLKALETKWAVTKTDSRGLVEFLNWEHCCVVQSHATSGSKMALPQRIRLSRYSQLGFLKALVFLYFRQFYCFFMLFIVNFECGHDWQMGDFPVKIIWDVFDYFPVCLSTFLTVVLYGHDPMNS